MNADEHSQERAGMDAGADLVVDEDAGKG